MTIEKKRKKKGHMGQKAKRAARPARKMWPGGFALADHFSLCVSTLEFTFTFKKSLYFSDGTNRVSFDDCGGASRW
jgi:hypothetical protein